VMRKYYVLWVGGWERKASFNRDSILDEYNVWKHRCRDVEIEVIDVEIV